MSDSARSYRGKKTNQVMGQDEAALEKVEEQAPV